MNRSSTAAGPPGVEAWTRPAQTAAKRQLRHAEIVVTITDLRQQKTSPYDIAVALSPSADPTLFAKAGATWWLADLPPEQCRWTRCEACSAKGPIEP
ncbi:hypothetical protein AB0B45_50705 [Nonomuraea sp. NPDC049152]|uniref:hypothetical protein n=1 Tax=Nonomuraea sp. NPDC049152 TaxID=3154350 RepID=UPI0033EAC933